MSKNKFTNPDGQFVISYELICLLEWIIKHNSKDLHDLIIKIVKNGLTQKIKNPQNKERILGNDSHEIILDFFDALENSLYHATTDELAKKVRQQDLLPAIEHIDTSLYNTEALSSTLEQVTQEAENNPDGNSKEKLLQELLKQWNPGKNQVAN